MTERLILRQNDRFETEFLATDPNKSDVQEFESVANLHQLTPYGMLLAGLAGCTALVLNTYAKNHELDLKQVELRLTYERVFDEDCVNCEEIERYSEQIEEEILLFGDLDLHEREKLFLVSKQCPIHRMVEEGIQVHSNLAEDTSENTKN